MSASEKRRQRLDVLLGAHRTAVQEFLQLSHAVPAERWERERAPGKWTPAQEVQHLVLFYRAAARDLAGGQPVAMVGKAWQRRIWRIVGLYFILRRHRIPRAVRAPREVRPQTLDGDRPTVIAALESAVDAFERAFEAAWMTDPRPTVSHPFFGALDLDKAMRVSIVHTRHHAAFVRTAIPAP